MPGFTDEAHALRLILDVRSFVSSESELFRREVQVSNQQVGNILLVYPISNYLLCVFGVGLLLIATAFSIFGTYTRQVNAVGVLEPALGVSKIYSPQTGVLASLRVSEGTRVRKGDVLLVFDSTRRHIDGMAIDAKINEGLALQLQTLQNELIATTRLHAAAAESTRQKLKALLENKRILVSEMQLQLKRISSSENSIARITRLRDSGFASEAQYQQAADELLEQQLRLQNLQKLAQSSDADIDGLKLDLLNQPLRQQVAESSINRNISVVESELSQQEGGSNWAVVAPTDGIVGSLTISQGQRADPGSPLITLLPDNGELRANLYVSSRELGFLSVGQNVKLKFDAFPYQKFGTAQGTIISIANSPIGAEEMSLANRLSIAAPKGEPVYLVRVSLGQQYVTAYGKRQQLRPGMQLSAHIQLETRFLYEWFFEPIYGLAER